MKLKSFILKPWIFLKYRTAKRSAAKLLKTVQKNLKIYSNKKENNYCIAKVLVTSIISLLTAYLLVERIAHSTLSYFSHIPVNEIRINGVAVEAAAGAAWGCQSLLRKVAESVGGGGLVGSLIVCLFLICVYSSSRFTGCLCSTCKPSKS